MIQGGVKHVKHTLTIPRHDFVGEVISDDDRVVGRCIISLVVLGRSSTRLVV